MEVILDANIWLGFIEKADKKSVAIFRNSLKSKKINILVPKAVESEYLHKLKDIKRRTLKKLPSSSSKIELIIRWISEIFEKADKIEINETGIHDWVSQGIAPNCGGQNYPDTIILNSILNHFSSGSKFYFISGDGHFRKQNEIHPDIVEIFQNKGLEIEFYNSYQKFLHTKDLISQSDSLQRRNELYSWEDLKDELLNENFLFQLEISFKEYFKELNFIPLSFLRECYPFNNGTIEHTDFKGGILTINNEGLFNFFEQSIIIENEKAIVNLSYFSNKAESLRFEKIIKRLNENLVYKLKFRRKVLNINLEFSKKMSECDCYQCLLENCNFNKLLQSIALNGNETIPELLQKSYYHFKIGKLKVSHEIIMKIISRIEKAKSPLVYFICQFNLEILSYQWLSSDEEWEKISNKIKLYKEDDILKNITSIIAYFKYSKFYDYKYYDLEEDLKKVRKRYYSHLGSGNMSFFNIETNNVFRLAEFFLTIEKNGYFFDYFSNTKRFIVSSFELALIASNDRKNPIPIPYYIMQKSLTNIDIKDLKELIPKLDIHTLNYYTNFKSEFYSWFESVIKNFQKINSNEEKFIHYEFHSQLIEKIIFILPYIKLSRKYENFLIQILLEKIQANPRNNRNFISCFATYLDTNISKLYKYNLSSLFKLVVEGDLNEGAELNIIFKIADFDNSKRLSKKIFSKLLDKKFSQESGFLYHYILLNLYLLGSKEQKRIVLQTVHFELKTGEIFDHKLFFIFRFNKIIKHSPVYLNLFKKKVYELNLKNGSQSGIKTFITTKINVSPVINLLIDYVYFYNPKKAKSILNEFLGHTDYIDFLIDPFNFEYSKIDSLWLVQSSRAEYAERYILKNHKKVYSHLLQKISTSNNEIIKNNFLELISDKN